MIAVRVYFQSVYGMAVFFGDELICLFLALVVYRLMFTRFVVADKNLNASRACWQQALKGYFSF